MLIDILSYFKERKIVSLQDLSLHFKSDTKAMQAMLQKLIDKHRDPVKAENILSFSDEVKDWVSWELSVQYGFKDQFSDMLDFFVNVPSLFEALDHELGSKEWFWHQFPEESTLSNKFSFDEEVTQKLVKDKKLGDRILQGYVLEQTYGRIDEDITWSRCSYLIETDDYFLFFLHYSETLH